MIDDYKRAKQTVSYKIARIDNITKMLGVFKNTICIAIHGVHLCACVHHVYG